MREQTTEKPWWFPVITDAAWCERIRSDYSEDTDGMDDDDIREQYADGCKYADLWDNLGDAREQFEKLADAYLELLDKWNRRAAPVVSDESDRSNPMFILEMIASRARNFPDFPMGYHLPEVFKAVGQEQPRRPDGDATPPADQR